MKLKPTYFVVQLVVWTGVTGVSPVRAALGSHWVPYASYKRGYVITELSDVGTSKTASVMHKSRHLIIG
jgi:hypothetical protein